LGEAYARFSLQNNPFKSDKLSNGVLYGQKNTTPHFMRINIIYVITFKGKMENSIFLTILSGVSVFVLGQFVLKLVLELIVSLKNVFGELSALFLREQASITNANADEKIQNEMRRLSSSILAHRQAIPFYKYVSFILRLPNDKSLYNACGALNIISYKVTGKGSAATNKDVYDRIQKEMKKISENLKITTEYGRL
jgi:hypothetical protein